MAQNIRGRAGAYLASLFFIVIIFFLLTRIINVAIPCLPPGRLARLLIERLVILLVVELGLALDQILHAHLCGRSEAFRG